MKQDSILERLSPTTVNLRLKHYKYAEEKDYEISALCRRALDQYIANDNDYQ